MKQVTYISRVDQNSDDPGGLPLALASGPYRVA